MRITIKDVADRAGVSKTTVSRYLNNVPNSMSEETKIKIKKAIEELDYKPNLVARSMNKKMRIQTIGVILADITNPFSTQITRGVEDICKENNFNMILCNSDNNSKKELEYLEMLQAKQIDGIIMQPNGNNIKRIAQIEKEYPLVVIDRKFKELKNTDTVLVNNRKGSKIIVNYLLGLGHQKIAVLTYPYKHISSRRERIEGYLEALASSGIEFSNNYIKVIDRLSVIEAVQELLNNPEPPTAIYTLNAKVTLETLLAFKSLNIKIPDDISLVGFDNPQWGQIVDPSLTVLEQPTYKIGTTAAELVIQHIKNIEKREGYNTVTLDAKLVVGNSCKKI